MKTDWVRDLTEKLSIGSLPGPTAHRKMIHPHRSLEFPPENAKLAGVMALFYPKEGHWQMVLIERQSFDERDQHKGLSRYSSAFHGLTFQLQNAELFTLFCLQH